MIAAISGRGEKAAFLIAQEMFLATVAEARCLAFYVTCSALNYVRVSPKNTPVYNLSSPLAAFDDGYIHVATNIETKAFIEPDRAFVIGVSVKKRRLAPARYAVRDKCRQCGCVASALKIRVSANTAYFRETGEFQAFSRHGCKTSVDFHRPELAEFNGSCLEGTGFGELRERKHVAYVVFLKPCDFRVDGLASALAFPEHLNAGRG